MSEVFIELRNIEKRFAGVHALDDVSLTIRQGEIHCLAGENGSGKSTVIKVMSGVYRPDSGEILIDGQPVHKLTPIESIDRGVQVIYQDFSLFGNLTVAENLALNTELREKRRFVNWRSVRALARRALDELGVDIDPNADLETLSTAGKQLVAIARALMSDARLLIMDEPTTALTGKEVETLFRIVRDIQRRGIAILFVSHKMREMLEISERITVIRNGRKVAEGPTSDFNEGSITRHMTGHDISSESYRWQPSPGAPPAPRLEIKGLSKPGAFSDLDLAIRPGEIVGLSGLLGSGRTEVALSLFGMEPGYSGTIEIDGQPVRLDSVGRAIAAGIAYVPEDRLSEGLFLSQSIDRNILATSYDAIANYLVIDRAKARAMTADMIRSLQIATPTGEKLVSELSGGNQQRVVLARWLLTNAKVMVLNGPTVGVDVGSKAAIHHIIRDLAVNQGLAVLMISDDVLELVGNCNRIVLMHRGRFVADVDTATISEEEISDQLKSFK
ncbi:sugar ABC transporter ATP-binding protein [Telmatospirillum sp.]|uniref:sugar ABC transporter ATP-binding protein n=1 Tax=Telmatospirillum sp. TaxID=2079197 RepID=UPI00283D104F|nr:sugar ABC transporter ATP-binding protein [Telmatospirillum sp.]MDR3440237.1 sugar ABC transporter ATP-binding protein [Telmatospirillum sp.]